MKAHQVHLERADQVRQRRQNVFSAEQEHIKATVAALLADIGETRNKIEQADVDDVMGRQRVIMHVRRQQLLVKQTITNVKDAGAAVGAVLDFLEGMQKDLDSMNSKLDGIATALHSVELRVAGRPPLEQINMIRTQILERDINQLPSSVYIPTTCLEKGDREPFFAESDDNPRKALLPMIRTFLKPHTEKDRMPLTNLPLHKRGLMLIHGSAGSGKSSAAKNAISMILSTVHEEYERIGLQLVVIKVPLPVMANPISNLVPEALRRQYGMRETQIMELKEQVQRADSMIRVVIVLDGVDELKAQYRSKNLFCTNSLEEWRPASPSSAVSNLEWPKVVVLCRSAMLSGENYEHQFLPLSQTQMQKMRFTR